MLRRQFLLISATTLLAACAKPTQRPTATASRRPTPPNRQTPNQHGDYLGLILASEQNSRGLTQNVLRTARKMTLDERFIIRGGCWDYLDAAWTRAGVNRQMRQTVFKSSKDGAYANPAALLPGDWLYHINHSYHNIEHSGMFIGWIDFNRRLGLTLSYAGGSRHETGRYRVYDLSSVYQIIRAPQ